MIRNKNEEHFKANQGPERGGNLHSANLYLLKQWLMLGSQSWWSEGILMQRKKSLMSDIGPFIGFPLRVHSLPFHSLYKNIQYKEKKSKDLDLQSWETGVLTLLSLCPKHTLHFQVKWPCLQKNHETEKLHRNQMFLNRWIFLLFFKNSLTESWRSLQIE